MAIETTLLKQRVKGAVRFDYFRDGALWYTTEDGWVFPVPVTDTINAQGGSPTFNAVEKGIILMRWMRKAMEREDALRQEATQASESVIQ
jgi:hypothetical protein